MNATGDGPSNRPLTRQPAPGGVKKEATRKPNFEAEGPSVRGPISDISPLPINEDRQPIELQELGAAAIVSKSTYENKVKLKDGSLFVAYVAESLKIKILSPDMIEVEREFSRSDKNKRPIGQPTKSARAFRLGEEKSVAGYDMVWKFEGSTLFYQVALVEGGFRKLMPLFRQNDTIKCVAMSGYSRENGTGPVKIIGADGSIVEILSSKSILSSCDVIGPP